MTALHKSSRPSYATAAPHPKEEERIRALHDLQVLDTQASPRFDRITALAADLFDVPTALISLVDVNRQWFLSRCGLGVSETDRDVAFCAHAILDDAQILVVEDARSDARFTGNSLVVGEPYIRFYAGAVISDSRGLPLGTLCLIDYEPRAFSEADRRRLMQLAHIAQVELIPDSQTMMERTISQLKATIDPITHARTQEDFAKFVDTHLREHGGQDAKFILVDIDNLSTLNNTFGRSVGDKVLIRTADRLRTAAQAFGRVELGRINSRRLAAFLTDCAESEIEEVESAIVAAMSPPIYTVCGEMLPVIGIGLSVCRGTMEADFSTELKRCRLALQAHSGQQRVVSAVFCEEAQQPFMRQIKIGADLPAALDGNAFHLVYQPKVRATDGSLSGFECLLRWRHEELDEVSPCEIVEAAKELNLTQKLDQHILKTALIQMARWRAAGLDFGSVSINISGHTLLMPNFASWLGYTLRKHGVSPSDLDLEIVESSIFDNFDAAVEAMLSVRELGVSFSLDDFGTGYSSLAYLRALPVGTVKMDRSFVKNIVDEQLDAALCAGVVDIARDFGLTVVAEGVETEQQYLILRAYRCDLLQGFYFSKPLSADAAAHLMSRNT